MISSKVRRLKLSDASVSHTDNNKARKSLLGFESDSPKPEYKDLQTVYPEAQLVASGRHFDLITFDDRYPRDREVLEYIDNDPDNHLVEWLNKGLVLSDQFIDGIKNGSPIYSKNPSIDEAHHAFREWFELKNNISLSDVDPINARIYVDSQDVWMQRSHGASRVIVDAAYLYDPAYEKIDRDLHDGEVFLQHMIEGFSAIGNDHQHIRCNLGNVPNGVVGLYKDYAARRSGNMLFHDLRLTEFFAKSDLPVEMVSEYATLNLLNGYYFARTVGRAGIDHIGIYPHDYNGNLSFELAKFSDQRVPIRMLKPDEKSGLKPYGFTNYLSEIIAIAYQCDLIMEKSGRSEKIGTDVGYCVERTLDYCAKHSENTAMAAKKIVQFVIENDLSKTPLLLSRDWFRSV